ncbi:uncharacterized protein LOC129962837 [Argiope bruennichi]|uniref:uncharacterized protein LOC129962837 n=1 Tax=Argiope bruennichi TaxID=94029 RepID=UPI002494333C|nr:uncharacterized protein LOC129962837 [Argiope bruennichi]
MRSGDLLVEVNTRKQAQNIQKLKALATIRVSVTPHQSLNTSKGVITCGEIFNLPVELITEEMKPQGVINVKRITIKRDGEIIETKHHILTFKSPKLPEHVYAGYIKLPVKPYIPNPLRCFKCQRFGHSRLHCRGTDTCARCAKKGHDSQQCVAPEKCVNCGDNHASYSRSCPRWQLEKQIATIKINENLTYPEARRRVQAQTPTTGITYASVVKKTFCANCSCANCIKQTTKTKDIKISHSDTENSISSNPDPPKETREKPKRKSKTSSLTLRLAKRGLSQKDLPLKLKAAKSKNSVALGLATQGIVHKDLSSIFGGMPNSSDIKLHPSEDENDLGMSCEDLETPTNAHFLSPSKPFS